MTRETREETKNRTYDLLRLDCNDGSVVVVNSMPRDGEQITCPTCGGAAEYNYWSDVSRRLELVCVSKCDEVIASAHLDDCNCDDCKPALTGAT